MGPVARALPPELQKEIGMGWVAGIGIAIRTLRIVQKLNIMVSAWKGEVWHLITVLIRMDPHIVVEDQ